MSTPVITGVGSPAQGIALPWARRHVGATMGGIKSSVSMLACAGITREGPGALLTRAEPFSSPQSVIADATSKFWYT
jgi:hypothetical protein